MYNDWRVRLGDSKTLDKVKSVMAEFMGMLKADEQKYKENPDQLDCGNLKYPYWICQPYVRPE